MFRFISYLIVCAFTSLAIIAPASARAASVKFEDAQGQSHSLDEFTGKPVVVNIWASWCAPCVAEMPSLALMQEQYAPKGLTVLAISEDDSRLDAKAFYLKAHITSLPVYTDVRHITMRELGANGIPTSVFIDKNGDVIKVMEGAIDWQSEEMTATLDGLVKR